MANVLFISEQAIKDTTYLDENIDLKLIRDVIELCQDKYIHPLLGSALFNDITTQINADSSLASYTHYQTLLNTYVQKALKWWVLYEGVGVLTYKMTNKTISKKNSENSQPIENFELKWLMDNFSDNAEMYSERVTKYLRANLTTFTLYSNPGSTIDTIVPQKNSYRTTIYIPDYYNNNNSSLEDRFQGNFDTNCE